jgi:uncharacterized FAD-dependent dehydrogenase
MWRWWWKNRITEDGDLHTDRRCTKARIDKNTISNTLKDMTAGDRTGLSRDLVNSAATGILAARGRLKIHYSWKKTDPYAK